MRLSPSDLRALTVFRAVVEHGSFLGAQVALGLSQSAVSFHIKSLEARLGYRLCRRGRGGFSFTDRGAIVYERSKAMFTAMASFESELGELRARLTGTLHIGIVDNTVTDPELPLSNVINAFLRQADGAELRITIGEPEHLITELGNSGIDIAILPETQHFKGLDFELFHEEVHSLYCGKQHPLYDVPDGDLDLDLIREHPFVVRPYAQLQELQHYSGAPIGARASNMEAKAMFILSGDFLGYLPDHYAAYWADRGAMRPLLAASTRIRSPFFVVTRSMSYRPMLMRAFIRELVRWANLCSAADASSA